MVRHKKHIWSVQKTALLVLTISFIISFILNMLLLIHSTDLWLDGSLRGFDMLLTMQAFVCGMMQIAFATALICQDND